MTKNHSNRRIANGTAVRHFESGMTGMVIKSFLTTEPSGHAFWLAVMVVDDEGNVEIVRSTSLETK